jgi:hypothetical protein
MFCGIELNLLTKPEPEVFGRSAMPSRPLVGLNPKVLGKGDGLSLRILFLSLDVDQYHI